MHISYQLGTFTFSTYAPFFLHKTRLVLEILFLFKPKEASFKKEGLSARYHIGLLFVLFIYVSKAPRGTGIFLVLSCKLKKRTNFIDSLNTLISVMFFSINWIRISQRRLKQKYSLAGKNVWSRNYRGRRPHGPFPKG